MATEKITEEEKAEYRRARAEGRAAMRDPAYVIRLKHDKQREMVELHYRCGGIISIPRRKIPGLGRKRPLPGAITLFFGEAVSCRALDVDVFIPGLIEHIFGPRLLLRYVEFEELKKFKRRILRRGEQRKRSKGR
jgi:hypothetical protein